MFDGEMKGIEDFHKYLPSFMIVEYFLVFYIAWKTNGLTIFKEII